MCILALCQHKCFFSHESFAFLIHSFFLLCFFSSSTRLAFFFFPFVLFTSSTVIIVLLHASHFTSFYSRQFHYRFKILLFNCFSVRFCLSRSTFVFFCCFFFFIVVLFLSFILFVCSYLRSYWFSSNKIELELELRHRSLPFGDGDDIWRL